MANAIEEDVRTSHRARTKRSTQEDDHDCKIRVNKIFMSFVDSFTSYDPWIERKNNIENLKKHYVSTC